MVDPAQSSNMARTRRGSDPRRDTAARLVTRQAEILGADLIMVVLKTPGRLLDLCSAVEAQVHDLEEPALTAIDATLPLQSLTLMSLSLCVASGSRKGEI
jgi:hypothetical protein